MLALHVDSAHVLVHQIQATVSLIDASLILAPKMLFVNVNWVMQVQGAMFVRITTMVIQKYQVAVAYPAIAAATLIYLVLGIVMFELGNVFSAFSTQLALIVRDVNLVSMVMLLVSSAENVCAIFWDLTKPQKYVIMKQDSVHVCLMFLDKNVTDVPPTIGKLHLEKDVRLVLVTL